MPASLFPTYVSPDGTKQVSPTSAEHETRFAKMGWVPKNAQEIRKDAIRKTYDGWKGEANALAVGALEGIPGLQSAAVNFMSPENQQALAQAVEVAHTNNPITTGIASLATGTAALATGEAAIGAAVGGSTLLGAAARSGVVNTIAGMASRKDQQAIAHVMSPGGEEHLANALGWDNLVDFATGAAVPLAFGAAQKAVKALGQASAALEKGQMRRAIIDSQKLNEVVNEGKQSDVWQAVERDKLHMMSPDKAGMVVRNKLEDLSSQFNIIKGAAPIGFSAAEAGQLADHMGTILGDAPIAPDVVNKMTDGLQTVGSLHQLRQYIDKHIDYKALLKDPTHELYEPMFNARQALDGNINKLLERNDLTGGGLAEKWKTVNSDYSTYSAIQHSIRAGATKSPLADFAGRGGHWTSNAVMMSLLWRGLSGHISGLVEAGAIKGAAALHTAFQSGELRNAAKALGAVFDATHDRMAGAVEAGLYGAGGAWAAANNTHQRSHEDYELATAQLDHMARNPEDTFGKMAQSMMQSGLPEDQAIAMTQRTTSMAQFLLGQVKQPAGLTMMARKATPSKQDKKQFMASWNACHDPASVIANPTSHGLEVLQNFYPGFLSDSRQAVLQQLQDNPDMPLSGRIYASKLLGGAVDTLTSPNFGMFMSMARQQATAQEQQESAQAQQGGKKASSSKSSSDVANSNMTRSEQLANRGG